MTLKRLRARRKMTQKELAVKVGIHPIYLAQIEGGVKVPSLDVLERLARALKVKVTELLE